MFQENSIETCILSRVERITSPGWMHETSARTWCNGKTQRERVEREVGGGIGMGNTCKPIAVSFQCMTKSTTKKKKNCTTWELQVKFYLEEYENYIPETAPHITLRDCSKEGRGEGHYIHNFDKGGLHAIKHVYFLESFLWPPDVTGGHWRRLWCLERLRAEGEGGDRGWADWVASLT